MKSVMSLAVIIGCLMLLGVVLPPLAGLTNMDAEFSITPEYERQLGRVVVSLATRDTTLTLQHELLAAIPEYTKIILLLPEANEPLISHELTNKSYGKRVELVTYKATSLENSQIWMLFPENDKFVEVNIGAEDSEAHDGSVWAQDLFEVMTDRSGRTLIVQPFVQKWLSRRRDDGDDTNGEFHPDNLFSTALSKIGLETLTVPVSFFGGNLLMDERADGQRIAFCGADMFATTRTIRSAIGSRSSGDERVMDDIKQALGVDQVVVFKEGHLQPYLMFHLDQAMLILADGVVAIPRVVGAPPSDESQAGEIQDARLFLAEVRQRMRELDY